MSDTHNYPWFKEQSPEIAKAMLQAEGLRFDDTTSAYLRGKRDGARESIEYHLPWLLASIACALHKLHQLGPKRLEVIYSEAVQIMDKEIMVQDMMDRCKWETRFDVSEFIKDYSML